MRLIDADKLKPDTKTFTSAYSEELTEFYSQEAIDSAPTIEAEPVRHGTWKHTPGMNSKCSECGHYFPVKEFDRRPFDINYCSHCGAKMDGGIPDETIHDKK